MGTGTRERRRFCPADGLAAGVLALGGINMPPAVAAIVMSLSTIVVALNAQTLRRFRLLPE